MRKISLLLLLVWSITWMSCSTTKKNQLVYHYTIDDKALYDTISALDSIFFYAYNTCDQNLALHASFYADSLEFYHDKGGMMNSKTAVVEGIRKNVCGKVRRELVAGSLEVYPIPGYGAIEMGLHCFINSAEPDVKPHASRFTIIWQRTPAGWRIRKVISLH